MSINTAALCAFCLVASAHVASPLHAQTNFYDHVTRMWLNGQKQEVYCIATNRLAANSNDITGLVLKMEYENAFLNFASLTNTMQRTIAIGSNISTTNFSGLFPRLQEAYSVAQWCISNYPANDLAQDIQKATITNKPMLYRSLLRALEADGLLGN